MARKATTCSIIRRIVLAICWMLQRLQDDETIVASYCWTARYTRRHSLLRRPVPSHDRN